MYYDELKDRSWLLQSLTGMNTTEFSALLPSFSAAWESFKEDDFESKSRKRAPGAGRKAELEAIEDKLKEVLPSVYDRLKAENLRSLDTQPTVGSWHWESWVGRGFLLQDLDLFFFLRHFWSTICEF